MSRLVDVRKELRKYADKEKSKVLLHFFKTGPGEYAEGDIFLGITVPFIRKVAKQFQGLPLSDVIKLLRLKAHEERVLALLILVDQFNKADAQAKEKIYKAYLANTKFINNWDLVDLSAPSIVGAFLMDKNKQQLYKLGKSNLLWERRIAILATFYFLKNKKFKETLKISKLLISDKHDLIHKAVGWMLRELGKRDQLAEELFLDKYCSVMPRTMLRYAIERFPEEKRSRYLRR